MNNLFTQAIMRSPTYQAVVAEADAELVADRQAIIDQLVEIDRAYKAEFDILSAKDQVLSIKVKKLRDELQTANAELGSIRSAWLSKSSRTDSKRTALLASLDLTISPALRRFFTWIDQLINDLKWKVNSTATLADESGRFDQQAKTAAAASPIIDLCQQAKQWALDCKLQALPEAEILATIESYVDAIYAPALRLHVTVGKFRITE